MEKSDKSEALPEISEEKSAVTDIVNHGEKILPRLYFKLKLLILKRTFNELGLFFGTLCIGAMILFFGFLIKTDIPWITPTIAFLILTYYHGNRRDTEFLHLFGKGIKKLLAMDYTLLAIPFISISLYKEHVLLAVGILAWALLLPQIKQVKIKDRTLKLPFLFKGDLEFLRLIRQNLWIYAIVLLASLMGTIHGNIKVLKAGILIWGLVQASGYFNRPNPLYTLQFKNFRTFIIFYLKSILWNTTMVSLPFLIILFFQFSTADFYFMLRVYVGMFCYTMGIVLLRQLIYNEMMLVIFQFIVLFPPYIIACFFPPLLLAEGIIPAMFCFFTFQKFKKP